MSGRPSLDLVATIGERWRRAFERLRTPADLGRWAVEGGFVNVPPEVDGAHLEQARQVRQAVARLVFAWTAGEPLGRRDLEVLNEGAARPDLVPALTSDGTLMTPATASIGAVLATVSRDAIHLLATGDPRRVRECAADDCSLVFHDASRPGTRRWCSMAGCGNRAKTTRFRTRRAAAR